MNKYAVWKSALATGQTNTISRVLNEKKESGEIKTESEYKQALNNLLSSLQSGVVAPLMSVYKAKSYESIDSETYNLMLERIQDDLSTLYSEAQAIAKSLNDQDVLFNKNVIPWIRNIITNIKNTITTIQALDGDISGYGFTRVQYNVFYDINERLTRLAETAENLFYDSKTNTILDETYDAYIYESKNALSLPLDVDSSIQKSFTNVKIEEQYTTVPDFPIETNVVNGLGNILDGSTNSFWKSSLYFSDLTNEVTFGISLGIVGVRKLNYLQVSPVSEYPIILSNILYEDVTGNIGELEINETGILGKELNETKLITFLPTYISRIILVLEQKNKELSYTSVESVSIGNNSNVSSINPNLSIGTTVELSTNSGTAQGNGNIFTIAGNLVTSRASGSNTGNTANLAGVNNNLYTGTYNNNSPSIVGLLNPEVFPVSIREQLGATTVSSHSTNVTAYRYDFGLAEVSCGLSYYKERGIFVSPVEEVESLGLIGLVDNVTVPESDVPGRTDFSIEYSIYKEDYDTFGNLLRTKRYSILPFEVDPYQNIDVDDSTTWPVRQEIVYPDNDGYCSLRFKAIAPPAIGLSNDLYYINVYKNNELLTENTDWVLFSTSNEFVTKIQINYQANTIVDRTARYTVSYIPCHLCYIATYGQEQVGLDGLVKFYLDRDMTLRITKNNIIEVESPDDVFSSKLNLIILLRSLKPSPTTTMYVNSYKLLMGVSNE